MKLRLNLFLILILLTFPEIVYTQKHEDLTTFTVVRIKYDGGGDWYGNKTTIKNLLQFVSEETGIKTTQREITASITDESFLAYPTAYLAGHGNIRFSKEEAQRLRRYLISGGFLFADDDYGMDISFRREMKKVFPGLKFVELPFSHLWCWRKSTRPHI